jgi:lipid A 3-O-deacylase
LVIAMFQRHIAWAFLFMAAAVCTTPAYAIDPDGARLMVGAGIFGFGVASEPKNVEGRIQYRFSQGIFSTDGVFRGFKPQIGFAAQTKGSQFGYAALTAPFVFGAEDRWEIVLEGGPGYYRQGSSTLNLGGKFEFHLAIATSYTITDSGRLGVGIYHISNANFHDKNPGVNSILVSYTFAFDVP